MKPIWLAGALLTIAIPGFCAETVAWGSAVNGLRMGISFASDGALRVSLQNVSAAPLDALIGDEVGTGTAVNFKFVATALDGKKVEGFEINSFTPNAGLMVPVSVRIDRGATSEFVYPLNKIFVVDASDDPTFDKLVEHGSSLHVSFEADGKGLGAAGLANPWVGAVMSGELRHRKP